jgi:hypothetical protein
MSFNHSNGPVEGPVSVSSGNHATTLDTDIRGSPNRSSRTAVPISRSPRRNAPGPLKPMIVRYRLTILLLILAALLFGFTVFFAWNSTQYNPLSKSFLSPQPSRTILALNNLSHILVMILTVLAADAFETVRWALASSRRGISSFNFLVLSQSTGPLGVLYLLLFNSMSGSLHPFFLGRIHSIWGLIRYIFWFFNTRLFLIVLHLGVGVVLLADVTIQTTWSDVANQFQANLTGLSPFDPELAVAFHEAQIYWQYYPAAFTDDTLVTTIPPVTCAGTDCLSYFFPGGLGVISPNPAEQTGHQGATGVIVYDTPGYQIEYYPISTSEAVLNRDSDCHVYGWSGAALQICVKQSGNDIITGD